MWSSKRPSTPLTRALPTAAATLLCAATLTVRAAADEGQLPDSLGQCYQPANERQVWLHTMFALRRDLQAIREYAAEGDADHVKEWNRRLGDHYRRIPEMVPEWRDETDLSLIAALDERVRAGDLAGVRRAADRLENDCRSCHRQYQALAALRYRWPGFEAQAIDDGKGGTLNYREHMDDLSKTVNRLKIASADGRWDMAQASLTRLRAQLQALGANCQACHEDQAPQERILGAGTRATLGRLDQALTDRDVKTVGRALGEAAVQACARCHRVHRMLSALQRKLFD